MIIKNTFKNSIYFFIITSLLSSCFCAAATTPENTSTIRSNILVQSEWLRKRLNSKRIIVIDVRAPKQYQSGHIINAINIPVDQTYSRRGRTHRLAAPATIGKLFSNAGLSNDSHLILYDGGLLKDAARFFWVLKVYGHRKTSILDGGFSYWQQQQLPVSAHSHLRAKSHYIPVINHHYLTTRLAAVLAINSRKVTIIDSRSREEYMGLISRAKRYGHIPNARSYPWNYSLYSTNGNYRLKSWAELQHVFSNVNKNNKVVAYCNHGKESAVSFFILSMLGYRVSVYDGAWMEWGNDPTLPIVNPSDKKSKL